MSRQPYRIYVWRVNRTSGLDDEPYGKLVGMTPDVGQSTDGKPVDDPDV